MNAVIVENHATFGGTSQGETGPLPAHSASTPSISRKALWGGRVASGFVVLFLAFDATIKLLQLPMALEANVALGYPANFVLTLGLIEMALLVAYLVPRTAVLGAILWTGYLGGAIATHVRVGNPLFSHVLFPIYVALLLWGGLWLRDARLRSLVPIRRAE